MKIEVKVIPNARKNCIKEEQGQLKIYVTASPVDGKANAALVQLLAEHFHVKTGQIHITKGLQSRRKTINIREL